MGKLPVVCILTLIDKLTHSVHRAQTLGWLSLLLILHLSLGLCLHLVPLIGQSKGCVGPLDGAGVYLTGSVDAGRCLLPHAHRASIGKSYCSSAQQRYERHMELVKRAEDGQRCPPIHRQSALAELKHLLEVCREQIWKTCHKTETQVLTQTANPTHCFPFGLLRGNPTQVFRTYLLALNWKQRQTTSQMLKAEVYIQLYTSHCNTFSALFGFFSFLKPRNSSY